MGCSKRLMKKRIVLFLIALPAFGQAPAAQADITQAQTALTAALTAIASIPPPAADPVVILLQNATETTGTSLYARLLACTSTPNCRVEFVAWSCPVPAWAPATQYQFGQIVSDSTGNAYQLTGVVGSGAPTSGPGPFLGGTPPAAAIKDGSLTWTLWSAAGTEAMCSSAAVIPK